MKRHYFISDNLDDLESVEQELESRGLTTLQIHVLSHNDADVQQHKLHQVVTFMKTDIVRSTVIGALIGICLCLLTLAIAHTTGFTQTNFGWVPIIFLSLVLLGFCTWEGGLRGIQEPNHHFRKFQQALQSGNHILFVDVDNAQETVLKQVVTQHPNLNGVSVEAAGPHWVVAWQQKCLNFIRTLP
ncbi:MAG TPA: NAD/FAD-utilizing enzyme [Spongiibacteraceae bacterium]|nr:NAD/FAD-utilizing enzyme [Spongiibacteraceae bacterium]